MKNKEVIKILDNISTYIKKEQYEKAVDYIKEEKKELSKIENIPSEYVDELVKSLK